VKLLDFGLAWLMAWDASSLPLLPTSGTPPYMAPEQWKGEPQDERTDLWAVGVLLFEMLTGEHPFPAATLEALRTRILSEEAVPSVRSFRPELPEALDGLLASLLARAPARRLSSAVELRERLRSIEESLSPWREEPRTLHPGRRQVTLLGCWLTGLAGLAERLDAEDFGEVQSAFHRACSQVIQEFGGSVTLFMGDEVSACFGHPQAREDDSECAARAGLKLLGTIREALCARLPFLDEGPCLAVKVGIHTDTVVFDDIPPDLQGRTPAIQGEAPRIALWLARQGEPNSVSLSGTTSTRVHGSFQTQPLGMRGYEGLTGRRDVEVHRLLRERKAVLRFSRSHGAGGLSRFVGRERELRQLLGVWDGVLAGRGAFVVVSGEAGIGKSRLIEELRRRVPPTSALRLQCQCWSQFSHSAFRPIIEMLQHVLRLTPGRGPRRNLTRLSKQLAQVGMDEEQVGLIASFLSLPVDEERLGLQLSLQRRKEKTFEALAELLDRMARRRPLLATVEDLQWADPSTLELLGYVLERVGVSRIGVVLSTRPDFRPAWPSSKVLHTVELERLPAALTVALVRDAAGDTRLPLETVEQLVEKTDGVPLFVEELTRMVLARGPAQDAHGPRAPAIPVTLNELLLHRLDLLPPRQKALAQLCSVVGRSVSRALLATLTASHEAALLRDLTVLREAGVLQPEEDTSEPGYHFRHALLQEAAYQSLVRSTRRRYHGRIAQALAARFPEVAEAQPEVLAHHCTEAGQVEPAIRYWTRAGELASRRSANVEAVSHLGQALTLLRGLPDASARGEDELRLLLALGIPLMQLEGCSFRMEQTYARAWELLFALGDALPRLGLSYWGIFSYYFVRAKYRQAHRLSEHLVALGERHHDRELLALGLRMVAVGLFTFGRMPAAAEYIERARVCSDFDLERHRAIAVKQWINPRVAALAYGAVVYSVLDARDTARRYDEEALRLAEEIGHPNTTAFALTYTGMACQLRREPRRTLEKAQRCIALSREHQFRVWLGWCTFLQGWAVSELGQPRQGLAVLQAALGPWRDAGMRAGLPFYLSLVAESQLRLGRAEEALASVTEALGWADTTGERSYEVELYRLEGQCLGALGQEREALESFRRGLELARQQGAVAYERRVEESVASLFQELGATTDEPPTLSGRM
jgi:class 3 adenylate cyclase/tetratricopeptide (TPR) repeat protein